MKNFLSTIPLNKLLTPFKGYENKGWMKGLRFGFYIGIFYMLVVSFQYYAMFPLESGLVLQMFIYAFIQVLILGIATALVYKPKEAV